MNSKDKKTIDAILKRYDGVRDPGMIILEDVQREVGYVGKEQLNYISEKTGIPMTELYGVATFYSALKLNPPGRKIIRVCRGTACHVRGGALVLKEVQRTLGIKIGQTTEDGEYTLETVACVGACALAPTVVMGEEVHRRMSPKKIVEMIAVDKVEGGGKK